MKMEFKLAIYLVEDSSPIESIFEQHIKAKEERLQQWRNWIHKHFGKDLNVKVAQHRDGVVTGFQFPELPPNWRKPDANGASMPYAKNPIRQDMPQNKSLPKPETYFQAAGIDIPIDYRTFHADGKTNRLGRMGHWFEPIQLLYTIPNGQDKRLMAVGLPDYEMELGRLKLELKEGETMYPPPDFDFRNLLPDCRIITEYEWNYLANKWQESLKPQY